jgi:quercetin dioxygenase-like cupin family protein
MNGLGGQSVLYCAVYVFPVIFMGDRIFKTANFVQVSEGEPVRSVITESEQAVIVLWHLLPGQRIASHIHPQGQDSWTILSGEGEYVLGAGEVTRIGVGDVAIAPTGAMHGVLNCGEEPLVFVSVVSPGAAGYELVGD